MRASWRSRPTRVTGSARRWRHCAPSRARPADGDPADEREALTRIVQDADHLTSIVNGMLLRSRARRRPHLPVTLELRTALERWRRQAGVQSVELRLTVAGSVSEQTACAALVEVLDPVVDNATRHTPPGGRIGLDVRRSAGRRPTGWW